MGDACSDDEVGGLDFLERFDIRGAGPSLVHSKNRDGSSSEIESSEGVGDDVGGYTGAISGSLDEREARDNGRLGGEGGSGIWS